jgi:signal transduction histidine kinase
MRERAQLVGGNLQIKSKIGGGTTVSVEIPSKTMQEQTVKE